MGKEVVLFDEEIFISDLDLRAFCARKEAETCLDLGSVGAPPDNFWVIGFTLIRFIDSWLLVFKFEVLFRKLLIKHLIEKKIRKKIIRHAGLFINFKG